MTYNPRLTYGGIVEDTRTGQRGRLVGGGMKCGVVDGRDGRRRVVPWKFLRKVYS